jgi:hypothetical protein
MAFNNKTCSQPSSFHQYGSHSRRDTQRDPQFEVLDWYPQFLSCHQYFLNHAQHTMPVQMLAALINMRLPSQKQPLLVDGSSASFPRRAGPDLPHLELPDLLLQKLWNART